MNRSILYVALAALVARVMLDAGNLWLGLILCLVAVATFGRVIGAYLNRWPLAADIWLEYSPVILPAPGRLAERLLRHFADPYQRQFVESVCEILDAKPSLVCAQTVVNTLIKVSDPFEGGMPLQKDDLRTIIEEIVGDPAVNQKVLSRTWPYVPHVPV